MSKIWRFSKPSLCLASVLFALFPRFSENVINQDVQFNSSKIFGLLASNENETPFTLKTNIRGTGHFNSEEKPKSHCFKPMECQALTRSNCLGATLPYKFTSFSFVNGTSLDDVENKLLEWISLKMIPRCWAVIQAFLCAVYLPRCDAKGVFRPPRELCRITRGPCRILELSGGWPDFLQCNNENLFSADCKHDMKEIKFNLSGSCHAPLVESDQPSNWYKWVDGCGVQCMNPLVSLDQHKQIHSFIAITGSLCLASNIFAVLTFLIDWRNSRRYPAVIIFYINGCYMMACIGWLSQFTPDGRRDIVCHQDGTARRSQPSSGETLSCLTVFILIYYFMMAAAIWFVLLTFAWDLSFRSVGIPRKVIQSKSSYFHLAAWSLPFVMTIAIMAMQEVDGDSVYGICFVAFNDMLFRTLFLLAPLSIAWIVGTFFLTRGLMTLMKVKFGSSNIMSHHVKSRIKNMIIRLAVFVIFISVSFIGTLVCHTFEYMQREDLEISLQQYIVCLSMQSHTDKPCKVVTRPNLLLVHLQILSMFGNGLAMSSWIWTSATFGAWRRFIFRLCRQPANEPVKLKRHKMIAQAFAHRDNYSQGHMTLSCDSTHEDPVGMNLEVKSVASRAPSSTWAAALPKFLMRRGALSGSGPLGLRRHSSTSDISQCPNPMVSLSGRRHSMDSQNSLPRSEQDWIATELARQRRRKTRKERERLIRGKRLSPWLIFGRRGSDTSQQSSAATGNFAPSAPKKVTKATSTGDLDQMSAIFYRPPTTLVFPVTRPLIQRQPIVFPPFTHGMADNSLRVSSEGTPLLSPNRRSRITVPRINGYAVPNQVLPMAPSYPLPTWVPYSHPYVGFAALVPNHEPIIPMNPMPDSCSEADFFPIVMSDSDFTDTGFRSPQEEHIAKLVRDRINAVIQPSPIEPESPSKISPVILQSDPSKELTNIVACPSPIAIFKKSSLKRRPNSVSSIQELFRIKKLSDASEQGISLNLMKPRLSSAHSVCISLHEFKDESQTCVVRTSNNEEQVQLLSDCGER